MSLACVQSALALPPDSDRPAQLHLSGLTDNGLCNLYYPASREPSVDHQKFTISAYRLPGSPVTTALRREVITVITRGDDRRDKLPGIPLARPAGAECRASSRKDERRCCAWCFTYSGYTGHVNLRSVLSLPTVLSALPSVPCSRVPRATPPAATPAAPPRQAVLMCTCRRTRQHARYK